MRPICITLGDPAGIGPEVTFKALKNIKSHPGIILFMHPAMNSFNSEFSDFNGHISSGEIKVIHVAGHLTPSMLKDDATNATIAHEALQSAIKHCKKHKTSLVTAPISKAGFLAAKIPFTGHTTLLKKMFNCPDASMAFHSKKLNVVLCTIHLPLSKVEPTLTQSLINSSIKNAIQFGQSLGINQPRIAVAGLNPHASEHGQFGSFEKTTLIPLLNRSNYLDGTIHGPISPDIVFRQALENQFDVVVAMYHDQGLIPIKLLAFDSAVNVTIGLPICRTSPDHGTAYDIAGKGIANPSAMTAAIEYAIKYGS